jgi:putative ABC transport system permease protein
MFRNYLKTAFRNLIRHKGFSFINLLGLTVGLSTFLFIILWIKDEVTYDRFNKDIDRIYEVFENQTYSANKIYTFAATPGPLAEGLQSDFPEVESITRSNWGGRNLFNYKDQGFYADGRYADSTLLTIFTFRWLEGNPDNPMPDQSSAVICSSLAKKLFGDEPALGKMVRFDNRYDLKISGVYKELPSNSSLQCEFVVPFSYYERDNSWLREWGNNGIMTFLKLKPGADYHAFNKKFADYIKTKKDDSNVSLFLHPYKDLRLYSNFEKGKLAGGRITYVKAFAVIALFILIIACINFMNLTTARSSLRTREVGVRKVVGAHRFALINQFLSESFLLTLIAMLVSVLAVRLLLPFFNELTSKKVGIDFFDLNFWIGFMVVLIVTAVLSGSYPAFFLSAFKPAMVLKGQSRSAMSGSKLRKILVVIQFSLSVILIISAMVIYKQIDYIQNKDLGFDKENVLYFWENEGIKKNFEAFRTEVSGQSFISGVGEANSLPYEVGSSTSDPEWDGKKQDDNILFQICQTDYDMVKVLGFELREGRYFSRDYATDSSNVIINEKAASLMGMMDPVGQRLDMWERKGQIIGVVKDFHSSSLYNPIEPLIFRLAPENTYVAFIRIQPGKSKEAVKYMETEAKKYDPAFPFEYHFLDKSYEDQYKSEMTIGKLADYFTGIAIFIACLGLFGLASFTVERRTKEISIRKVFGASVSRLVVMLCGDFAWLILAAIVIGSPVAWYFMDKFLNMYAFHTAMPYFVFALTSVSILAIALLTVGFQSLKASMTNPASSLRTE